jgi:hypothetical protein
MIASALLVHPEVEEVGQRVEQAGAERLLRYLQQTHSQPRARQVAMSFLLTLLACLLVSASRFRSAKGTEPLLVCHSMT